MRALTVALVIGSLAAADPAVPSTAAAEVDPVTRRRAEEALQALAAPAEATPSSATLDPALLGRIQEVEAWLRECAILVEADELSAAGERFLKAAEALKAFNEDERRILGKRYRIAADRLAGFARGFAEASGPVDEEPAQAAGQP